MRVGHRTTTVIVTYEPADTLTSSTYVSRGRRVGHRAASVVSHEPADITISERVSCAHVSRGRRIGHRADTILTNEPTDARRSVHSSCGKRV